MKHYASVIANENAGASLDAGHLDTRRPANRIGTLSITARIFAAWTGLRGNYREGPNGPQIELCVDSRC